MPASVGGVVLKYGYRELISIFTIEQISEDDSNLTHVV